MKLVPDSFTVPERHKAENFIMRKLCARDAYLDYIAVMSSIDIIRKTRGGNWPTPDLTFEDDWIDLAWHQREFENRSSFAYTVMNLDETECFGCLYFYPPGFRTEVPEGTDVDISFWVTQQAYEKGVYQELYKVLKNWIDKDWQFKKPYWSNAMLPNKA